MQVFFIFLRLGLTSFGGPIAHLGYFRDEFVTRRKWLSDSAYADLVSLCQFLPGPASSQVGMAIGYQRSGFFGALGAWLGFTLPSAIVLLLFAIGMTRSTVIDPLLIHGLKVAAVSVVAHAVFGMWKNLCPDPKRRVLALLSCVAVLFIRSVFTQVGVLVCAGIYGAYFLTTSASISEDPEAKGSRTTGVILMTCFFGFLFFLPIVRTVSSSHVIELFDSFYRSGSLVFGGGHVVLPLLQSEVVNPGWMTNDTFMAGYGIANAVPGPLFSFAAYLGAASSKEPNSLTGGVIALCAVFLPAFLLIIGALPFWEMFKKNLRVRRAMLGLNAGVVGLLLAALYYPVTTSALFSITDVAIAVAGFVLLQFAKLPSWALVIGVSTCSYFLSV